MRTTLFIIVFLFQVQLYSQVLFYYKFKKVEGDVICPDSGKVHVTFKSRRKLLIENCNNPTLDTFLRTMTLTRISRKYLQHLLTTASAITLNISEKAGIQYSGKKYWLIAGITCNEGSQSTELIADSTSNLCHMRRRRAPHDVYKENTITIFKGSINYLYGQINKLDTTNTVIYDKKKLKRIFSFNMDTIKVEPVKNVDLLYKNMRELFYFAGIHELHHTTAANIDHQTWGEDSESDAYKVEIWAFKRRKGINRKKLK